jgi:hypothetical protein
MTLANIIVSLYALLCVGMLLGLAWHLYVSEKYYRKEEERLGREIAEIDRQIEECERMMEICKNKDRRLKTAARNKGWKIK